jgi:hypothetical protein
MAGQDFFRGDYPRDAGTQCSPLIELSGKRSAFQKRVIECIRQMARKIQPPPYRHCEEGGVWIEWMIFSRQLTVRLDPISVLIGGSNLRFHSCWLRWVVRGGWWVWCDMSKVDCRVGALLAVTDA